MILSFQGSAVSNQPTGKTTVMFNRQDYSENGHPPSAEADGK